MLSAIAAGIAFGVTALLFARTTHAISALFKKHVRYAPLRPFIGGVIVAAAVFGLGNRTTTGKYIGLGIPTIVGRLLAAASGA